MPDLRERLRGRGPVNTEFSGARLARLASKALFVLLFFIVLAVSAAADSIIVAALIAGPAVSAFVYVVLPIEQMRDRADWLWRGDAGEEAYDEAADALNDTTSDGWFR